MITMVVKNKKNSNELTRVFHVLLWTATSSPQSNLKFLTFSNNQTFTFSWRIFLGDLRWPFRLPCSDCGLSNSKCRNIFAWIQLLESYFTFRWSTPWAYRVLLWQASYILIESQMSIAFYTEITLNFFWVCIFWSWLGRCFCDIMKR